MDEIALQLSLTIIFGPFLFTKSGFEGVKSNRTSWIKDPTDSDTTLYTEDNSTVTLGPI